MINENTNQYKNVNNTYNIILIEVSENLDQVIEFINKLNGKSLAECRNLINSTPAIIDVCDSFTEAQEVKKNLVLLGAKIKIESHRSSVQNIVIERNKNKYIDCTVDNTLQIKCPNCSSTNTKKISSASKTTSALLFGVFSIGKLTKTWECRSCKYRW